MAMVVSGFELPNESVRVAGDESWTAFTEVERLSPDVVEEVFGVASNATAAMAQLVEVSQ